MAGVSRYVETSEWAGKRLKRDVRRALAAGLNKHVEQVFKVTREQVPKDSLDLLNSGAVIEATAQDLVALISYGETGVGDTQYYALLQHEDMSLRHPFPGTKAKYVEDPVNESAPRMGPNLARELRRRGIR